MYCAKKSVMWFGGALVFFLWVPASIYGTGSVFDKSLDEYVSFLSDFPGFSLKAVWAVGYYFFLGILSPFKR